LIVVVQRVCWARVRVEEVEVGAIDSGLVLLTCALNGDSDAEIDWLADKIVDLRVFSDNEGRTNLSVADVGGALLVVPQFTLAADWRKGRRPSFTRAADPETGRGAVRRFSERLVERGLSVAHGRFGATMQVELLNDGPFTLVLDSAAGFGN